MNALLKDLPPEISAEQEQMLLSLGERETLVLHTLRGAFSYMRRLSRGRLPDDELLSAAYSALSKAAKNFKPGWAGRFLGYARPYMRGEVAAEWRAKETVRNSGKHKAPIENDERPAALVPTTVDPPWESLHWKEAWEQVEPVIRETLTATELRVLEYRYKFSMTLQDAGDKIGKSRERVRQIEVQALKKLRAALSSRGEL